jgi:membrane fusion protein (multidrug efflux system)
MQPLLAARAVAQLDVDNAQTAVEQAQAAFDQAKKDYEDTFIRAGISGRAGRTQMELGARVAGPGDLLTTIEQVDPIYVNFSPSDAEMLRGRRDMADGRLRMAPGALAVQVMLADGTVFPGTGTLNFADLALQPTTGTNQLRATFPNRRHVLLPGQFVRVRVLGFQRPGAILVPQRAVQQSLGGSFLYVVGDRDRVAARSVVATGWQDGAWFIEQGLGAGDRVIIDGIQKVGPGQRVKPVAYRPAVDVQLAPPDSARTAPPDVPLRIQSRQ